MKFYTCTNHDGHWPVGVASVIFADDKRHARRLLDKVLVAHHLRPSKHKPYDLKEVPIEYGAYVLHDGEY